jgi:dienelactone hydrolase
MDTMSVPETRNEKRVMRKENGAWTLRLLRLLVSGFSLLISACGLLLRRPAARLLAPAMAALWIAVIPGGPETVSGRGLRTPGEPTAARVLAPDERSDDGRLGPLRTLDSHCPFSPPATLEAWRARAADLRRQIRVALGLWPWPARTPLHAEVHGVVTRDDYVVERVTLESVPGHFVTGNVYRPRSRPGRLPAVLTPHGHWPDGRFERRDDEDVAKALATGAEPFEVAARYPMQARAVHLARLGAVAFLFDMEGYADSVQVPMTVAHRLTDRRPWMEGASRWGFFSPQAELRMQSVMGQQAWNAIRALDYLSSRDDVDPARIGVTGESGGGTQTFILGAIDERPAALFPAVMVSTHMQGGCTCENASYLRIGTGNAEIASLAAPRPLGMTAADDWTRQLETDGLPDIQRVYAMTGAPDRVALRTFPQFPHNYNGASRAVMYDWFNRHLGLGWKNVPPERLFEPLTREEATVWNAGHPAPARGEAHERALLAWWTEQATREMAALVPANRASLEEFKTVVAGAWEVLLGGRLEPSESVIFEARGTTGEHWGSLTRGIIRRDRTGAALPATVLSPPGGARQGVLVWIDEGSKQSVWSTGASEGARKSDRLPISNSQLPRKAAWGLEIGSWELTGSPRRGVTSDNGVTDAKPVRAVRAALRAGFEVLAIDVLGQGELVSAEGPIERVRLASERAHAGYTYGYNLPLPAQRTQDVLAAIRIAQERAHGGQTRVHARGVAAAWAAGARVLTDDRVDDMVLELDGFRYGTVDRIDSPDFLPGAVKYGDVPALIALGAPHRVTVLDPKLAPAESEIVRSAYRAAGAVEQLVMSARAGQ